MALPKVIASPQAALSPGLSQMPPAGRWPGAAQFPEDQAVTQSTGFQARQSLHSTVLRNAGASDRGRDRFPEECYLPVTVRIPPAAVKENPQLLQQSPSQQQAQNKHIDLGFVHSSACATAEAQMGTGRPVSGSPWQQGTASFNSLRPLKSILCTSPNGHREFPCLKCDPNQHKGQVYRRTTLWPLIPKRSMEITSERITQVGDFASLQELVC